MNAEVLLLLGQGLLRGSDLVIVESPDNFPVDETGIARMRLAMEFAKRPGLVVRALVEEWDLARIRRELY